MGFPTTYEQQAVPAFVLLETVLLFYFSVVPFFSPLPVDEIPIVRGGDIEHYLAYLVYGLLWARLLQLRTVERWAAYAIMIAAGIGFLNEAMQAFVPERHFDLIDGLLDIAGAATGAFIARKLARSPAHGRRR